MQLIDSLIELIAGILLIVHLITDSVSKDYVAAPAGDTSQL